jgi:ATP-dependent helicase HepA
LYLEAIYVLECVAPPHLHIDRFLAPTPLRILVDHLGNPAQSPARLRDDPNEGILLESPEIRDELVPHLIQKTEELASQRVPQIVAQARADMTRQMELEVTRLRELHKVNPSVRTSEIDLLVEQRLALDRFLSRSHLRLDALRLIQRGDFEA